MLFAKRGEDKVESLRDELKVAFSKIKEELDDHLDSINQNDTELRSLYEYMARLNDKVDKISQRMESMEYYRGGNMTEKKEITTIILSREEEELLALLMSNTHKKSLTTYEIIADKMDISTVYSSNLVSSLLEKGIPVVKRFLNGNVLLELDKEFMQTQVQYNIVTLD